MESSSATSSNGNTSIPKPASRNGVRVVGKIWALTESEKQSSTNPPQISMSREDDHFIVSFHNKTNGLKDTYILDGCYEQDESTSNLFAHEVKPLLQGLLHGENCCVLSYGDRGSGKSQLIQGSLETPGLAVMAFCEIFSSIEEAGGSIDISCYEMYNDHIYDLLESKEQDIQVMEDADRTIWLKGLSKIHVKSLSDFENFYFHTSNQRKVPQKAENEARVKSHKCLIMHITYVDKESKNSIVGKINFMDLAGYEDVRKRVDAKASIAECNKINKSLYALRNVLRALNDNELYIPYRESKLTRLLQDFLCSTNNSVLITCLSPTLCPHTLRAFSMASKSCQFVNREKQCRRHFLPNVPIDGIHPMDNKMKKLGTFGLEASRKVINENPLTYKGSTLYDIKVNQALHNLGSSGTKIKKSLSLIKGSELNNTMQTKRLYGLGSSRTKIKDSSSTSKGRFSSHDSAIKKATASPHWSKKTKLFNVAYPLSNTQKKENLCNKEGSIGFNDIPIFGDLKEGSLESNTVSISGGLKENATTSPKDVSEPTDHIQEDIGSSLISEDYSFKNGQQDSLFESNKLSPTLTEQLRELSNRFKDMSSRPKSLIHASMEPKTPRPPLSSRVDNILVPEKYATPHEKFKARSVGLKKSLVNECLDFLNSANKEELKQLKGIGEKRANYILELREQTPEPFKDVDDLMEMGLSSKQIKGLMSKILSDI